MSLGRRTVEHSTKALAMLLLSSACAGGVSARDDAGATEGLPGPDDPTGSTGEVEDEPPEADACEGLDLLAQQVREEHCAQCHEAPGNAGGFDDVLDDAALLASGRIIPGHPDQSPMFGRIDAGQMPPPGAGVMPDEDIEILREWIACMEAVQCTEPGFVPLQQVLETVRADLLSDQFNAADRKTIRYFTLTQVYNGAACEEQVATYRFGLSKLLNSLSRGPQVVAPVAIDPGELIYRIDLDDYRWTADRHIAELDVWELLVESNPYAIEYTEEIAEDIKAATGSLVPIMGGDWFITGASQAALYHQILGIPPTLDELARTLEFDGIAELEQLIDHDEVIRSGFRHSGVSSQNRMIERYAQKFGAGSFLWISYDFLNEGLQGGDLMETPLGPNGEMLAPDSIVGEFDFEQLFAPDGGEAIFSLPNGLQGYMLYDSGGCRLDRAPSEVVTHDAQKDSVVVNGISCMDCHDHGMIDKDDHVREHVEANTPGLFSAKVLEKVKRLHPPNDEVKAQLEQDRELFLSRLDALSIPIHVNQREPIFGAYRDFDGRIDLKRAAAELGIEGQALQVALSQVGLVHLVDGETIARQAFEAKFANAVQALNIGRAIGGTPPPLLPPGVPTPECSPPPAPEPDPNPFPDH
jgi:mono/diheme cytochrome c family protein